MTGVDIIVMIAYFAVVLAIGAGFARQGRDPEDYFLGGHAIPWWAVMMSIVATETSALTVISIPGIGARTNFTFLQVVFGYLVGRIGVSIWLLPGYFTGTQTTAYQRLETRFGPATRRLASVVFMIIRAFGDSVRVFATAIPLSIVTGWSPAVSVTVVASVTLVYTLVGGIKAVVWVDVLQLIIYTVGGIATIVVVARTMGGLDPALARAAAAGKLQVFDFRLSLTVPYTFVAGLVGGAMLSAASHGTDQLIVQRVLSTRSLSAARKALIGSGIVVIGQFALFLLVGTMLWALGADDGVMASDRIFPAFVTTGLPPGLAGLVVAGILAAAMSTVSSSLNSLASSTTYDLYGPLTGEHDQHRLVRVGRVATLGWAIVLAGGALLYRSDQPVVELALSIASITYGSLLGTFILALKVHRCTQRDAMVALLASALLMLAVVLPDQGPFAGLAWPWYVPLGTTIAVTVGVVSSAFPHRSP